MKKFFLIPLMACFTCVMAWGATKQVGDFDALKNAIDNASNGDVIELTADIAYPTNGQAANLLNIKKSITLDGKGYTLSGWSKANIGINYTSNESVTLAVNYGGESSSALDVTIKNITVTNSGTGNRSMAVIAYDGVEKLTFTNANLIIDMKASWVMGLLVTGADATPLQLKIEDSFVTTGDGQGYPAYFCKPIAGTFKNTEFKGYCALYFKYRYSKAYGEVVGPRGSVVNADACTFTTLNYHNSATNGFAVFAIEDDGITLNLHNCSGNAKQTGTQKQSMISLQYGTRTEGFQKVTVNITGDNSHYYNFELPYFALTGWNTNDDDHPNDYKPSIDVPFELNISGGTFAVDPSQIKYHTYADGGNGYNVESAYIDPAKYEVKTVKQGDVTVYRVVKKTSEGTLNDNSGNNPETSFAVTSNTTLNQATTTAGYVSVSSNAALTVGGTNNQKLVVNNGLDVQDNAEVVVKAGSSLVVGEGGIISEKEANIILEASEGAEAVNFLLHPDIDVNATPKATYKFKSQARMLGDANYIWQRFGAPTCNGDVTMTWEASVKTALYAFNYSQNKWEQFDPAGDSKQYVIDGDPFQCYLMTINANPAEDVEYTFTGELMGNKNHPLEFVKGWNYYANSYTAPIDIKSFLLAIKDKFPGVSATVYVYKRNGDGTTNWVGVNLGSFAFGTPEVSKIPPMQAFILQLQNGEAGEKGSINYEENVYNPFMGIEPNHAPARVREESNLNGAYITVTDGVQTEELKVFEGEDFSDAFDNGWDAEKFDNENNFSLYCQEGETKLSSLATNDLTDKTIAFNNKKAGEFTLKAVSAVGTTVKLYDAVAKKLIELTEGTEYKFTADAIDDAARFIINPSDAPAAIDNTEIVGKASKFVKDGQLYIRRGDNVYTVQGQNVK